MPPQASPVLEARGVSKSYRAGSTQPVRALVDVSVTIRAGEFVVLTGASGSGKTTLLALLGAMDRPTTGEMSFDGRRLAGASDVALTRARRQMGFVFQGPSLIAGLTVGDNIAYPLIPRGVPSAERHARAVRQLERLGLSDRVGAFPGELSGGEQQRVAVARALATEPRVLLADEPTSQLDPTTAGAVQSVLEALHRDGMTIVLCTHDPRFVSGATQVYRLEAGRLV